MSIKTTLAAVAVLAVAGLGLWSFGQSGPSQTLLPVSEATAQEATTSPAPAADEIKDMTLGSDDAKVTMIEYASYTCPHCKDFHDTVFEQLKKDYIDTGKIKFVYREVYFDRYGLWAAMIARCGGDMRYFGIQDILYETQSEWTGSDDPAVVVENLKKIGRTAGMDDATLDACMQDTAKAEALVAHFEKGMEEHGIQGTPSFVINGTTHTNMPYADLKALLDAELAK